jgi:hypothetical protein
MSFWIVPDSVAQLAPARPLLLRDDQVHRVDHWRRRIDRHGRRDRAEVDPVEQRFHVRKRRDVHAAFTDLAERQFVVRIAAHERWQIERHAQSRATRLQ